MAAQADNTIAAHRLSSTVVLGVETSGQQGTLSLLRDKDVLKSCTLAQPGRRHAQTLVSEVHRLLDESGLAPSQVELVAVSIGPGSFTGLRVGVVFAKTYAYATGAALVAVDTLCAIAAECPAEFPRVHVIADAQRGELFLGTYHRDSQGDFRREGAIRIVSADEWAATLDASDVVAGPGLDRLNACSGDFRTIEQRSQAPAAETIARLGLHQLLAGNRSDPWDLEPFYLRRSAAEERAANSSN